MLRGIIKSGLLAALALLALGQACGEGSGGGGFALERFARLQVEPPEAEIRLPVGSLPLGASTTLSLTLRSTGEAALVMDRVLLDYAAPEGVQEPTPAFSLPGLAAGDFPLRLDGAAPHLLELVFTHHDRLPREARVVVESNDRDAPRREIRVVSYEGRPVALVSESSLDFGIVREGEQRALTLTLLNNGDDVLSFEGFRLEGRGEYTLRDEVAGRLWPRDLATEEGVAFETPVLLEPGRSRAIRLSYRARDAEAAEGQLTLFTNDEAAAAIPVRLVANGRVPRLRVEPDSVDYGLVGIGATQLRTLQLIAGGTAPVEIFEIALTEDSSFDFAVEYGALAGGAPSPERPLFVPVNDVVEFSISFVPDTEREGPDGAPLPDTGSLVIRSNAYEEEIRVPLAGTGIDARCPEAVVGVREGSEVPPQTVLHLSGEGSVTYCGEVAAWEWTVLQPEGSVSSFLPAPSFSAPSFPANVAGSYRFCLELRDTCGIRSCAPTCETVVVVPDERIHVELLWRTPGDPDPFDEGPMLGADMDLHFLHPYGLLGGQDLDGDGQPDGWFDSTYDCFFGNPRPDWGAFGDELGDNPSLDRDDTDGGGPENINLDAPEDLSFLPPEVILGFGGAPPGYQIGVHYWNDHGFGPSFATVRVYLYGELAWEWAEVEMRHRELWRVGAIRWPEAVVEPFAGEGGAPVIVEGYEHPGWFIP